MSRGGATTLLVGVGLLFTVPVAGVLALMLLFAPPSSSANCATQQTQQTASTPALPGATAGTPGRPGFTVTGAVSTFGPPGDPPGTTATGVSDALPGISLHVPGTHYADPINVALDNHWFQVTTQGHTAILKDIDLGPADYLNRAIDVTGAGVAQLGIPYGSFQTGAQGTAVEVAGPGPLSAFPTTATSRTAPPPRRLAATSTRTRTRKRCTRPGSTWASTRAAPARSTRSALLVSRSPERNRRWLDVRQSVNGGVVYQPRRSVRRQVHLRVRGRDPCRARRPGRPSRAEDRRLSPHGCDEMGWAVPPGTTDQPLAETLPGFGGDQSPQALAAGDSMSRLLKSVNGPPGVREGAGVGVQAAAMPAGYP